MHASRTGNHHNLPNPTLSFEAKSAYWGAVATLIHAKIPLSDSMVHGDLESFYSTSWRDKSKARLIKPRSSFLPGDNLSDVALSVSRKYQPRGIPQPCRSASPEAPLCETMKWKYIKG